MITLNITEKELEILFMSVDLANLEWANRIQRTKEGDIAHSDALQGYKNTTEMACRLARELDKLHEVLI